MKKHVMVLAVIVIMGVATSGSIWEGAAALGSNGELPDSGYYAASSSFPRNTVVDVTNLETRKTVRVIIAGPLESPGLLALLSREAAASIGLSSRSVGRVRITQPADPVAFSRFTEGNVSNGDSDFDPRAAVAANYPHLLGPVDSVPVGGQPGNYPVEPSAAMTIVDIPPAGFTPGLAGVPDGDISGEPVPSLYPEEIPGEAEAIPPALAELPANDYDPPQYTAPPGEPEFVEETQEYLPEYNEPELSEVPQAPPETVPYIALPEEPIAPETPPELAETAEESGIVSEITLIPAEERPPEAPGFTMPPVEAPVTAPPAFTQPERSVFSVPVISRLESGKYYLQLGAYAYTDSVEAELSRLERTYPLSVQVAGAPERPLYRILVGPVNMGECGALLQRFKTIGYGDAFIRQDG
ncbi:MAG: SPOR domain-containing protein [Spirochaetaceae bacterium]|jgi:cell division protein FtsN|nr:SPOR domain-containing protein [Spirochaetaceae bacterium]